MYVTVTSSAELGLIVRAQRRAAGVRIDDAAATAQVSKQFTSDVERGKETVQLGLVFKLLDELGVILRADVSPEAAAMLHDMKFRTSVKPAIPRKSTSSTKSKAKSSLKASQAKVTK